jgi:hypothetical protein
MRVSAQARLAKRSMARGAFQALGNSTVTLLIAWWVQRY